VQHLHLTDRQDRPTGEVVWLCLDCFQDLCAWDAAECVKGGGPYLPRDDFCAILEQLQRHSTARPPDCECDHCLGLWRRMASLRCQCGRPYLNHPGKVEP
jgi:hypothetical protein